MKQKTFFRVLIALTAVCIALTAAHFIYVALAYQHASIIYFIAKELW
jgi:hypothetical protein